MAYYGHTMTRDGLLWLTMALLSTCQAALAQMQTERAAAYYHSTSISGSKSAQGPAVLPREAREPAKPAGGGGRRSVDRANQGGAGWYGRARGSVVAVSGLAHLQGYCGGRRASATGLASDASGRKPSAVHSSRSSTAASRHGSVVASPPQGSPGSSEPYRRDPSPPPVPSDAYLAASYMSEDVIRRRPTCTCTCTAPTHMSYGGEEDVISVTGLDKGRAEREGGGDLELAERPRFGEDLPAPLAELPRIGEDVQAELSRIGEDSVPKRSAACR